MFLIMDNYLMDFCVASLNRVYLFCLWYRKLRWFYPGVRLLPLPCVCVFYIYPNEVYDSPPLCM